MRFAHACGFAVAILGLFLWLLVEHRGASMSAHHGAQPNRAPETDIHRELDLCELRLAARSGGDVQADMQEMQEAMYRMRQEPWRSPLEFDQDSGGVGVSPDGRALVLWFFSRR